ncbi:MAG: hypothetical protein J4428_01055 [Candidatus Aenigmarchaeota archaeon]|nr:hypothetical protein [Candidatus Aenigmarchaeota archaeon]
MLEILFPIIDTLIGISIFFADKITLPHFLYWIGILKIAFRILLIPTEYMYKWTWFVDIISLTIIILLMKGAYFGIFKIFGAIIILKGVYTFISFNSGKILDHVFRTR